MKVPSDPRKRYLGGADWCIAALSEGTAETTGRRCVFAVAVFLDRAPDTDRLAHAFADYCARLPVLGGRVARCWCWAPYWKIPRSPPARSGGRYGRHELPEGATRADVLGKIEERVNAASARRGWTAALDAVRVGASSGVLVFTFEHTLFDASGAEAFIDLFMRHADGVARADEYPEPNPSAPAGLEGWISKFRSGKKVNRLMRRLAVGATAWLPLPPDARTRPFRFHELTFTADEVQAVLARAYKTAGYLMVTPYALATAASVLKPFFDRSAPPGASFVVSVSTDKPSAGTKAAHVFFNSLSFLCFQFPTADAADRDALAGALREQLVVQAKEGVPAAIEDGNLLMRVLPARWLWRFLMAVYRNRLASFGFTVLGQSGSEAASVLGCRVTDRIHFPVIPTPPGIGLIVSRSGDRSHAVLSYIEGILTEEEAAAALAAFKARLLGEG
jgi:hypothetical protein